MKLSTTISKIEDIPSSVNAEIIRKFLQYMRKNGSSEHHQNNNLKVVLSFANYLGREISFYDIKTKEEIFEIFRFEDENL